MPSRSMLTTLAIIVLLILVVAPSLASADPGTEIYLGFAFPREVGEFTRRGYGIHVDSRGGAIAHYRTSPTDRLSISVYAFPAPRSRKGKIRSARKQVRQELRALLRRHADSYKTRWPPELDVPFAPGAPVHRAAIKMQDETASSYTGLLQIHDYGDRRLGIWVTYPVERYDAPLRVRGFLLAFPFP